MRRDWLHTVDKYNPTGHFFQNRFRGPGGAAAGVARPWQRELGILRGLAEKLGNRLNRSGRPQQNLAFWVITSECGKDRKYMNVPGQFDFHPTRNPVVRLNGVCPYFTMYPLKFPYSKLREQPRRVRVLDPFCGRGTTNFAARLHGLESVGIDSNPVAAAVAQAKLESATGDEVAEACRQALNSGARGNVPKGEFWELAYHGETLEQIASVRNFFLLRRELTSAEIVMRAVLLGIMHGPRTQGLATYLSNQMPRTYATKPASAVRFWRRKRMQPEYVSVLGAVKRRAEYLLEGLPRQSAGEIRLADSRQPESYKGLTNFDLVITSPPYLGMRTYWPDQWLRNWLLGRPAHVEYSQPEQVTAQDGEGFVEELATVWKACAQACRSGANMIIRFGALPSYSADPSDLIKQTLKRAGVRHLRQRLQ